MSSYSGWKPAVLVDSTGRQDKLECFTHDKDSEVYRSCSVTWNNELYIFGGAHNKRQISKLVRYKLQVIGNLPFDFQFGGCTTMASGKLFLCFSLYDYKRCQWSTEPLGHFYNSTLAFHYHDSIRISSSECKLLFGIKSGNQNLAEILAVGSNAPANVKTEIYNEESDTWASLDDYPYSGMRSNL